MMNTSNSPAGALSRLSAVAKSVAGAILVATTIHAHAATPVTGETYVYRLSNGYNNEPRAQISYRVEKVDAGLITVSVSTDSPAVETARTEIYTSTGNWLRRTLTSHDQPREFAFAPAFSAYAFPLEPGKTWSVRVNATDTATGKRNSVRIDGKVLGNVRIRVPAGEFDTIKIRRAVYVGDWDGFRRETHITETEWYAPALGRAVRSESNSQYLDYSQCLEFSCPPVRGDWNVYELVSRTSASIAAPRPYRVLKAML